MVEAGGGGSRVSSQPASQNNKSSRLPRRRQLAERVLAIGRCASLEPRWHAGRGCTASRGAPKQRVRGALGVFVGFRCSEERCVRAVVEVKSQARGVAVRVGWQGLWQAAGPANSCQQGVVNVPSAAAHPLAERYGLKASLGT